MSSSPSDKPLTPDAEQVPKTLENEESTDPPLSGGGKENEEESTDPPLSGGGKENEEGSTDPPLSGGGKENEEQEEGECGFCLFMKGGECRETFINWEKCVEEGENNNEDIVDKCFDATSALKKCMEAHPDYYGVILQAEKDAEQQVSNQLHQQEKQNIAAASTTSNSGEQQQKQNIAAASTASNSGEQQQKQETQ